MSNYQPRFHSRLGRVSGRKYERFCYIRWLDRESTSTIEPSWPHDTLPGRLHERWKEGCRLHSGIAAMPVGIIFRWPNWRGPFSPIAPFFRQRKMIRSALVGQTVYIDTLIYWNCLVTSELGSRKHGSDMTHRPDLVDRQVSANTDKNRSIAAVGSNPFARCITWDLDGWTFRRKIAISESLSIISISFGLLPKGT